MSVSGDGNTLKLEVSRKCGKDNSVCNCLPKPAGIEAIKDSNPLNATGFVALTHSNKGKTFTLLKSLGDEEELGEELQDGPIGGVKEVSVYYWDQDKGCDTPLLLKITKQDHVTPLYYLKYERGEAGTSDTHIWKEYTLSGGISLQALLDDRNLGRSNRIPLYLNEPEKPLDVQSDIAKSVSIQLVPHTPQLTETDYRVTEYKLNGQNGTRFSRVMLDKNRVNGIKIPDEAISSVKLYSSMEISEVPIMLQFIKGGGNSEWFHTQGGNGTQWGELESTGNFYKDGKPTEELTNKLDGFACEHHNAITMDISYDKSTGKGQTCSGSKEEKISVEKGEVKLDGTRKTEYTKYSITSDNKLANIKFYPGGNNQNRKKVSARALNFPVPGPVDIYTFYSDKNDPVLIYLDASGSAKSQVTGWYRKQRNGGDKKPWKRTYRKLQHIKKQDLDDHTLECTKWNALADILRERSTSDLPTCSEPTARSGEQGSQTEEGKEDSKEDDESSDEESERVEAEECKEEKKDSSHPDATGKALGADPPIVKPAGTSGIPGKADTPPTATDSSDQTTGYSRTYPVTDDVGKASSSAEDGVSWGPASTGSVLLGRTLEVEEGGRRVIALPSRLASVMPEANPSLEADVGPQPEVGKVQVSIGGTNDQWSQVPGVSGALQLTTPEGAVARILSLDAAPAPEPRGLTGNNGRDGEKGDEQAVTDEVKGTSRDPSTSSGPQENTVSEPKEQTTEQERKVAPYDRGDNQEYSGKGAQHVLKPAPGSRYTDGRDAGEKGEESTKAEATVGNPDEEGASEAEEVKTVRGAHSKGIPSQEQELQKSRSEESVSKSAKQPGQESEDKVEKREKEEEGAKAPAPPPPQPEQLTDPVSGGILSWSAFGTSSGTLAGAGSLTGLGWWAFKRSRGDPWVRQI
ncbi:hypothetical protein BEWA_048280 [Theileria equi strain WA]|uniref:Uncharacterized protein n=1 Tax=Theileria equi strain WA TaxID=1537102 RepID=L1LAL7_THEEQ|nr:hypothetical protein BEWA_048280 [Theileria equi strain WA]EKX72361.1 hypothetical protein BEWA_048280 [Theileria equi strain WA]|eukprot:XP_004831813.1 hypothetical protein BEWA_048280 [Theileria equi strain WA]